MYRCLECGALFDVPREVDYGEDGVKSVCYFCYDEHYEEVAECVHCGEVFKYHELDVYGRCEKCKEVLKNEVARKR